MLYWNDAIFLAMDDEGWTEDIEYVFLVLEPILYEVTKLSMSVTDYRAQREEWRDQYQHTRAKY